MSTSAISAYLETQGVLQENVLTRAAAKAVGMAGNVARKVPGFVMKQGTNLAIGIVHALIMNAAFEMFYKVVQPQQEQQAEEYYGPGAPPIREISDAELRAAMVEYLKKMPADQAKALRDKQSDVIREIRKKEKEEKKRLMVQTALKRGSKRGARDESWQESWSTPWDGYADRLSAELTEAKKVSGKKAEEVTAPAEVPVAAEAPATEKKKRAPKGGKPAQTAAIPVDPLKMGSIGGQPTLTNQQVANLLPAPDYAAEVQKVIQKHTLDKAKIEEFIKKMKDIEAHADSHDKIEDGHFGHAQAKESMKNLADLSDELVKQRSAIFKAEKQRLMDAGKPQEQAAHLAQKNADWMRLDQEILKLGSYKSPLQKAIEVSEKINKRHDSAVSNLNRVKASVVGAIDTAVGDQKKLAAHENAIKALQAIFKHDKNPIYVQQDAEVALAPLLKERDRLQKLVDAVNATPPTPVVKKGAATTPTTSTQTQSSVGPTLATPSPGTNAGTRGSSAHAGQTIRNPTNEAHFGPEITKEANDLIEKFNTAKASKDVAKQLEILDHIEKNKGKFYFDPGPGNGMKRGAFGSVGPSKSLYNARSLYTKEGREGWLSKNKMVNTMNASAAAGSAAAPVSKPNAAEPASKVEVQKPADHSSPKAAISSTSPLGEWEKRKPALSDKTHSNVKAVEEYMKKMNPLPSSLERVRSRQGEPVGLWRVRQNPQSMTGSEKPKLVDKFGKPLSSNTPFEAPKAPKVGIGATPIPIQTHTPPAPIAAVVPSAVGTNSIAPHPAPAKTVSLSNAAPATSRNSVLAYMAQDAEARAKPAQVQKPPAGWGELPDPGIVRAVSNSSTMGAWKVTPGSAPIKSGMGLGGIGAGKGIALGAAGAAGLYGIVKAAKTAYNALTKQDPEAIRNKTDKQIEDMIRANLNAYYDSPTVAAMGLDGKFRMRKIQLTIQEMRKEDAARRASPMARLGDLFRSDVDKKKMYEVHGQNPLSATGKVAKAAQETGVKVVEWSGKAASDVASKIGDHGKRSVITAGQMLVAHATNVVVTHVFVDWLKMDPAAVKSHLEKIAGSGHNHNISAASVQKAVQEESEKKFVQYYEKLLKDPDPNVQLEGQGLKDLWQKSAPNVKEMIAKDVAAKISQHKASPAFKAWIS